MKNEIPDLEKNQKTSDIKKKIEINSMDNLKVD